MQISGYGSLSEYYAELAKLRSQNSNRSSAAEFFAKVDSDGSRGVNAGEFSTMFSQAQSAGMTESAAGSGESVASAEKRPPPPQMSTEELEKMFDEADQDGDGNLSFEEFSAISEKMRQPPPEGAAQGGSAGAGGEDKYQELLSLLQGSSSYSGLFGSNGASSSTDLFNELLKSLGNTDSSTSSSGYSAYIQSMVKSAYGS